MQNIGASPWGVQFLSAPAGAGKTTSPRALAGAAHHRFGATVLVLVPTLVTPNNRRLTLFSTAKYHL